jgi:hypothetical protein
MLVQMWGSNQDLERLVERAGDLEMASRIRFHRQRQGFGSHGWVDARVRTTDGEGRFAFGNLSGGEYRLYPRGRTSTQDLHAELSVSLAPGEQRRGLRIVVPLPSILSGNVIGLDGRPVDGAHVMLSRADDIPEQPSMVIADQEGRFLFEVVHAKSYHLVVIPPIRRKLSDEQRAAIGAACVLDIEAPAGDLEIRMQPSDAVSGLVRDVSGRPVAGATVEVRDSVVGRLNWGRTDEAGQFNLRVPPRPSVDVKASRVGGSRTVENVPTSSQLVIELPDKP